VLTIRYPLGLVMRRLAHAGQGILRAMVLAAGVGSRLEPLTTQIPKPLVPIANVPVMEHILRLLKRHDFSEVCANLHYLPEQIENYFQDGSAQGVKLHFLREAELSGDAGGVRACRKFLGDSTFIVLMGDSLTDSDLGALISEHKAKKALATIGLKRVDDVSRFGVALLDGDGWIKGFQEKPRAEEAKSKLASTAIYILEPQIFDYIPKEGSYGFGRQLFPKLVEAGLPILGVEIHGYWLDVGTLDHYRQANFDALAGLVDLPIPGKLISDRPSRIWLEEGAVLEPGVKIDGTEKNSAIIIGKNSVIHSGARLVGSVVVGEDCTIEAQSVLKNTVLWSGSRVGAAVKITDSIIGSNLQIESGKIYDGVAVVPDALAEAS
jgi:mannose-1-phosphate guanylyltransferase